MEAEAEAEAIRIRGEAEAFAIQAKAKAEAEQMAKKADAWSEYKSAAMIDMMCETLPKVNSYFKSKISNAVINYWSKNGIICLIVGRSWSSRTPVSGEENNNGIQRQRYDWGGKINYRSI